MVKSLFRLPGLCERWSGSLDVSRVCSGPPWPPPVAAALEPAKNTLAPPPPSVTIPIGGVNKLRTTKVVSPYPPLTPKPLLEGFIRILSPAPPVTLYDDRGGGSIP